MKRTFCTQSLAVTALAVCVFGLAYPVHAAQNWTYTYNPNGQVLTADGPRSDVTDLTTNTYDVAGNLATTTNALGHLTQLQDYNGRGQPGKVINANGVETLLTYHVRGWLLSRTVQDPGGNTALDAVTTYAYDNVGQVIAITLPEGSVLNYEYNGAHQLTAVSNGLGERIEYSLDLQGNQTGETIKSDQGSITKTLTRTYDELSRLLTVVGAGGQTTAYEYDTNGNITRVTDGNLNATEQGYDALNRLVTDDAALSHSVDYFYDAQDSLTQVTDPKGLATTYTYDGFGNLKQLQSPDTGASSYDYDKAGNRIKQTDARGIVTDYSYDSLNRLTSIAYPGSPSENATYTYDVGIGGKGHLTTLSNGSGTSDYSYDALGNLIQETQTINGWQYTLAYVYDRENKRTQITYPGGLVAHYSHDAMGRVSDVIIQRDAGAVLTALVNNIAYVPFGGVTRLDYANGVQTRVTYDQDYRIDNLFTSGTATIRNKQYSYDLTQNITGVTDSVDNSLDQSYSYDELSRVTLDKSNAGDFEYQYDEASNRKRYIRNNADSSTYEVAYRYFFDSNKLEKTGNLYNTFDAAGNLLTAENGDKTYTYNHANRNDAYWYLGNLKGKYQYNGMGQRVEVKSDRLKHYHYDPSGKIIAESWTNSSQSRVSKRYHYIWLGTQPIAQIRHKYNTSGNVIEERLVYLHADHLSTPRLGTDESGTVVWRWGSDAFGKSAPDEDPDGDGSTRTVNLRFPGQIKSADRSTYYNYFRDYDPTTGRYVQSDRIGLAGGLNTYGYVYQNPLRYTDPTGEVAPLVVIGGAALVGAVAQGVTTAINGGSVSDVGSAIVVEPFWGLVSALVLLLVPYRELQ